RAIQRYIEDPLADEVLRQGQMTPGSTVMVSRDAAGDEEDKPLSLTIIAPKKPQRKPDPEPEKVGVGAKQGDEGEHGHDDGPDAAGGDAES
ncbi:MAG: ATP-dependent Clp protease ATP-binding subunit ClpC, partial [Solirubrobacterales bacterium]|nr:ATP-dependent Clp protease ATP-binding subunit ClpC [Solirubrobacterales bacterium]